MTAIILAGGFGTRLKSIISNIPKPMVPINGKPFLDYLFNQLLRNGIKDIVVCTHFKGEAIVKQALPKLRQLHDKGVDITILTSDKLDKESLNSISRVAKVKVKEGLFGGGIISDKRYVVILLGPDISSSSSSDVVAIWADHSGLAGFAREYFEYLLKDSVEVK